MFEAKHVIRQIVRQIVRQIIRQIICPIICPIIRQTIRPLRAVGYGSRRQLARVGVAAIVGAGLSGCVASSGGIQDPASAATAVAGESSKASLEPDSSVSSDVLYKLLVAEFAGRRGQISVALDTYLEVVRETRAPAAAERAVRIAVFARDHERGLEAARLWTEVAPQSTEARQVYGALLIRSGNVDAAIEVLAKLVDTLRSDPTVDPYPRIGEMLAREKDRDRAVTVMERLIEGRGEDMKAQFALGQLYARTRRFDEALETLGSVIEGEPSNETAVVLLGRILQRKGDTNAALEALETALEKQPDSITIRMTFARLLVDAKRYDDARTQFEILVARAPENLDVKYALGLLLLQTNRLDDAEAQFKVLTTDLERRRAAFYYLGQIAETKKDVEGALAAYRKVDEGEHRLNAQIRSAVLLAEKGEVERARAHLHGLRGKNNREVVRIFRAEAEILTRRDDLAGAMEVYDGALREFPQDTDLLYARAMLAEKLDQVELVERDLNDILSREPNNADALNALGYTLADRTDRIEEAYELVKRAYDLKPDDHYIVDSMGWVLYRLGRHFEALKHLRRAMELNPDPEIAAHLGEVLWVMGDKDEAVEIWDTALESTPDDKRLLDVKKRFGL